MKIALCLHGLFDSLTDFTSKGLDGFKYIKKNILEKHDVDVFIHSWDIDKSPIICSLYAPKAVIFEKNKSYDKLILERKLNTLPNPPRPPSSILSHFEGIQKVFNLFYDVKTEHYDCVIKSRFDLGRINRNSSGPGKINPYPVQCIKLVDSIVDGRLYVANWNHFKMGPPDMWFYGSEEVMKPFTRVFDSLLGDFYINSNFHKFASTIEGNPGDLSNAIAYYKYLMVTTDWFPSWNAKIVLDTIYE